MLTSHSVACWVQKGLIVSSQEDSQTLEEAINALTEAMKHLFFCFLNRGFGKMESNIRVFAKNLQWVLGSNLNNGHSQP